MTIPNDFELEEMTQAQVDKYITHNDDNRRIASGVAGRFTHNFASDANYTLSTVDGSEEWRYKFMTFTDTGVLLTAGRDVVFPAKLGAEHVVTNSTAQTLTLKISGQTGVALGSGKSFRCWYNGTDIVRATEEHALLAGSTAQAFACSNLAFPATQVPSADPNTIDGYEEGTFTPAVTADAGSGQTYTTQVGLYTKAGRHFSCTGRLALASSGTLSGDVRLTGLPAASNSTANSNNAMYVGFMAGMAIASGEQVAGYNNPTFTSVILRLNDTTTGGSNLQASEFGGTGQMMFGINYNE